MPEPKDKTPPETEDVEIVVLPPVEETPEPDETKPAAKPAKPAKAEPEAKEPEDDDSEYGEKVKKRISKEVWKRHEVERERDELRARFAEQDKRLKEIETRAKGDESRAFEDRDAMLKAERARLQRELKDASEIGDSDKIFEATEKIADVRFEIKRLEIVKQAREQEAAKEKPAPQQQQPQQRQQSPADQAKAKSWIEDNSEWFGRDKPMTGAAYAIDANLKEEGYDPNGDEYYSELTKRVRDAFPHKFKRETKQSPVAGVNRAPTGGRRQIKLTESEMNIAKRLGVPLAEYERYKGYE